MRKLSLKAEALGLACGIYGALWPLIAFVHGSFDASAWPPSERGALVALLPIVIAVSFVAALVQRTPTRPRRHDPAMRFWKTEALGLAFGIYGLTWPIVGLVHGSLDAGTWPVHERGMVVVMMPIVIIAAFAITILRRSPVRPARPSHR